MTTLHEAIFGVMGHDVHDDGFKSRLHDLHALMGRDTRSELGSPWDKDSFCYQYWKDREDSDLMPWSELGTIERKEVVLDYIKAEIMSWKLRYE